MNIYRNWLRERVKMYERYNILMNPAGAATAADLRPWNPLHLEPIPVDSGNSGKPKLHPIFVDILKYITLLDVHAFFLNPVTETIAPGYFRVIKSPMDISTMKAKTHRGSYTSLSDLEKDICQMLQNAVIYNEEGGIVYEVIIFV